MVIVWTVLPDGPWSPFAAGWGYALGIAAFTFGHLALPELMDRERRRRWARRLAGRRG